MLSLTTQTIQDHKLHLDFERGGGGAVSSDQLAIGL